MDSFRILEHAPSPGARAVSRCDILGVPPFSESNEMLLRRYLTPAHGSAIRQVQLWMADAGMDVRWDAMGNLIGRYEGASAKAPALLIGSHIDTVHDAGRYDGALGVMVGIEVVAALARTKKRMPFAIEVIAFGDEEGSRFPSSMLCSRALVGQVPDGALADTDASGVSLEQAMRDFGLEPRDIASARRNPGEVIAYLEAHIEQGPVLEAETLPIGVVTGIAAQVRLIAVFTGQAGHAGTSPMPLRRDALAAAAAGIAAVERVCAGRGADVVGTVGHVQTSTTAFNVIVGRAAVYIDIRAASDAVRDATHEQVRRELEAIARQRNLALEINVVQTLPSAPCDAELMDLLDGAVRAQGVRPHRLMSGAGHDAMVIAKLAPVAMLFIRCSGGVSHSPRESVAAADVDVAIRVLQEFVERLAAPTAGVA